MATPSLSGCGGRAWAGELCTLAPDTQIPPLPPLLLVLLPWPSLHLSRCMLSTGACCLTRRGNDQFGTQEMFDKYISSKYRALALGIGGGAGKICVGYCGYGWAFSLHPAQLDKWAAGRAWQ